MAAVRGAEKPGGGAAECGAVGGGAVRAGSGVEGAGSGVEGADGEEVAGGGSPRGFPASHTGSGCQCYSGLTERC